MNAIGYVYRINSETPGIQPITAKLRLSKEGNAWSVEKLVQINRRCRGVGLPMWPNCRVAVGDGVLEFEALPTVADAEGALASQLAENRQKVH